MMSQLRLKSGRKLLIHDEELTSSALMTPVWTFSFMGYPAHIRGMRGMTRETIADLPNAYECSQDLRNFLVYQEVTDASIGNMVCGMGLDKLDEILKRKHEGAHREIE